VSNPPTVTPPPTQTPSPGINFTVDRNRIFAGECVTFSWVVTGAQAVYFYAQGQPWQQNQVPPQGSRMECPPVTTNYELRVVKLDNSVEVRQITVFVETVPGAPVIERFTVEPPNQIMAGSCVDIVWSVTGNVSSVKLLRNNVDLWPGGAPISGTMQDCPPGTGQMNYVIEASGPGGTSRLQRLITVVAKPVTDTPVPPPVTDTPVPPPVTDTPVPPPITPSPIPPVIYTFTVNPAQIQAGDCVVVTWQVGGDVLQIDVLRNGVIIVPSAPFSGSFQDCLDTAGSYAYRLEALGRDGQTEAQDQNVTVAEAATRPPLIGSSWSLQSYNLGGSPEPMLPGTTITALFGEDGQLSGSSGCNDYSANYTADDSAISIGIAAGTQTVCQDPPGIMGQEAAYLSLLPLAATYEISATSLAITDGNGRELLRYTTAR
jgi:heat shock protein HslJ